MRVVTEHDLGGLHVELEWGRGDDDRDPRSKKRVGAHQEMDEKNNEKEGEKYSRAHREVRGRGS